MGVARSMYEEQESMRRYCEKNKKHAASVERNNEERWCNHCYCGKAMIIAQLECAFVALVSSVAWPSSTIFFHIIS